MTYRVGHHSTSDDSSVYRSVDEVRNWKQRDHPILRLKSYLKFNNWYNKQEEDNYREDVRKEIMSAILKAEKVLKPNVKNLFTDVYEEFPLHLKEQYEDLLKHVSNYKQHYPKNFKQD
jgi:2-oxoisovalerate dehydrogenase E1 component alpha subunit